MRATYHYKTIYQDATKERYSENYDLRDCWDSADNELALSASRGWRITAMTLINEYRRMIILEREEQEYDTDY